MATTNGKWYNLQFSPGGGVSPGYLMTAGSYENDSDNLGAALATSGDIRNLFKIPDKVRIHNARVWNKLMDTNAAATLALALKAKNKAGTTIKTLIPAFVVANAGAENETDMSGVGEPRYHILDDGTGDEWTVYLESSANAATAGTVGECIAEVDYSKNVLEDTP